MGSERFEPSTLLTRNTYSLDQASSRGNQPCRWSWLRSARLAAGHDHQHIVCTCTQGHSCALLSLSLQMSGTFKLAANGNVELQEEDGIDYAPVTVKAS